MATVKHHKVVAALPAELEPNAIYYVRAGSGFDQYVTNGAGLVVASPLNADVRSKLLDPSGLPAIRPSLRLDFVNNPHLDPRVTFTRTTGGGRFNANGQYEWLPANVPRIDYDPVTGECLGLLIEEQRTNLLTDSGFKTSVIGAAFPANWSLEGLAGGMTSEVVGVGSENGIDYVDLRIHGTAVGQFTLRRGYGFSTDAGAYKVFSVFYKLISGDVTNATIALTSTGPWASSETRIDSAHDRFTRFSVSRLSSGESLQPRLYLKFTLGETYDVVIRLGGSQLEAGSFP